MCHKHFQVDVSVCVFSSLKSFKLQSSFVSSTGLPPGFVRLHTLRGQSHTLPGGGASFQEEGHSPSRMPGGRHLVAGQEGGRLQPARCAHPLYPLPREVPLIHLGSIPGHFGFEGLYVAGFHFLFCLCFRQAFEIQDENGLHPCPDSSPDAHV